MKREIDLKHKRIKSPVNEDVETAMIRWFQKMRSKNVPISRRRLCEKEKEFSFMLGNENFKTSYR